MTARRAIPVAVLALGVAVATAQQVQESGRALDANLRLGSGGYNTTRVPADQITSPNLLERQIYRPPPAEVDYYNAFVRERRYDENLRRASTGVPRAELRYDPARYLPPAPPVEETPPVDWSQVSGGDLSEPARGQLETLSYAVGYFFGERVRAGLQRDRLEQDPAAVADGFEDGVRDAPPRIPRERLTELMADLRERVQQHLVEMIGENDPRFRERARENLERSRVFHEGFAAREGVVTLPSGVQYQVVEAGAGPVPQRGDVVVVNYKAMTLDGAVIAQASGAEVTIATALPGVAELLTRMPVGAKWIVAVPPGLAHGAAGRVPEIGPNQTLFGEIELVEIRQGQ